ncbi:MAG TPA: AmmeMemoRadiSam system protein B [Candidatus Lokiarchaeia archaeon]|nr:AmmeMemoRadiSam system protein B [Candidatus Lokiarchaeia archaeon]
MSKSPISRAKFAGSWYPGDKDSLVNMIEACFMSDFGPGELPQRGTPVPPGGSLIGIMSPHAGYPFSGGVASNGYKAIADDGIPSTIVLIAHHGGFDSIFMQTAGSWETPLGTSMVDEDVAASIKAVAKEIKPDSNKVITLADNTFELQLPFIQYLSTDIKIVPIAAGSRTYPKIARAADELSTGLMDYFVDGSEKKVMIVASTDMTHYGAQFDLTPAHGKPPEEQNEWINANDMRVVEMLQNLDNETTDRILHEALSNYNICCPGAITLAMETFKQLKAKCAFDKLEVQLLKHATSFDVEHRESGFGGFSAVGYTSLAIMR